MKTRIDISTYEQYVLDYIEGKLSSAVRDEFEAFLLAHPEISEEVAAMADYEPLEKPTASFDKNPLKIKLHAVGGLNVQSYEAAFADYASDILDKDEKQAVDQFVNLNPVLESDFNLYRKSVLRPDEAITYPQKSELKQAVPLWSSPQKVWLRVAAVLMVLIGSITIWNAVNSPIAVYDERDLTIDFSHLDQIEPVISSFNKDTNEDPVAVVVAQSQIDKPSPVSEEVRKDESRSVQRLNELASLPQTTLDVASADADLLAPRPLAQYNPIVSGWIPDTDQSPEIFASKGSVTEVTLMQYLAKTFLGLQPEQTATTSGLVKEGLKKAIDSQEQFAIQSQSEDGKKTFEFLAENFEFRRVNHH